MVPGKSKTKVKMKNCVKLLDDVTLQNPGLRPSMLSVYDRLCNRLCYPSMTVYVTVYVMLSVTKSCGQP